MTLTIEHRKLLLPDAKPIGKMNNKWRKRLVTVYPTKDPALVYTIGESTQLIIGRARPDDVETMEPRANWENVIRQFPRVVVFE
jgi:hypothetical protein